MKALKYLTLLLVIVSVKLSFAADDNLWVYSDNPNIYGKFNIFDTSRTISINPLYEDTAKSGSYNNTNYISFDYKFSADTIKFYDKYDPTTVQYATYCPGYAGFKIDWDNGITSFPVAKYKGLVIAHKGPLSGHKVTIRFGYNSGCGTPTTFNIIGSFLSSSAWKLDTIVIPDSVRNIADSLKTLRSYYEMEVLINNVDKNGSPSSAQGNLSIDDVCLITTVNTPAAAKKSGCGSGCGLAFIPPVLFKIASSRNRKKKAAKKA